MIGILGINKIEEHFLKHAKTRGGENVISMSGFIKVLEELESCVYTYGETELLKIQHIENELLNNSETKYTTYDLIDETNKFLYGKYKHRDRNVHKKNVRD